jgi:hypothetical protein
MTFSRELQSEPWWFDGESGINQSNALGSSRPCSITFWLPKEARWDDHRNYPA